jgi:hypothetical protein
MVFSATVTVNPVDTSLTGKLSLRDSKGTQIRSLDLTLVATATPGTYLAMAPWDGKDSQGQVVTAGSYAPTFTVDEVN